MLSSWPMLAEHLVMRFLEGERASSRCRSPCPGSGRVLDVLSIGTLRLHRHSSASSMWDAGTGVLDEIKALDLIKPGARVENRSSETDLSAWRDRHGLARPDMAPMRIIIRLGAEDRGPRLFARSPPVKATTSLIVFPQHRSSRRFWRWSPRRSGRGICKKRRNSSHRSRLYAQKGRVPCHGVGGTWSRVTFLVTLLGGEDGERERRTDAPVPPGSWVTRASL